MVVNFTKLITDAVKIFCLSSHPTPSLPFILRHEWKYWYRDIPRGRRVGNLKVLGQIIVNEQQLASIDQKPVLFPLQAITQSSYKNVG